MVSAIKSIGYCRVTSGILWQFEQMHFPASPNYTHAQIVCLLGEVAYGYRLLEVSGLLIQSWHESTMQRMHMYTHPLGFMRIRQKPDRIYGYGPGPSLGPDPGLPDRAWDQPDQGSPWPGPRLWVSPSASPERLYEHMHKCSLDFCITRRSSKEFLFLLVKWFVVCVFVLCVFFVF